MINRLVFIKDSFIICWHLLGWIIPRTGTLRNARPELIRDFHFSVLVRSDVLFWIGYGLAQIVFCIFIMCIFLRKNRGEAGWTRNLTLVFYMFWEISISISTQKTRNGPERSRKLWPKNAHADTLGHPTCRAFSGVAGQVFSFYILKFK